MMKYSRPLSYLYQNSKKSRGEIVLLMVLQIFLGFSGVWFAMMMRNTIDDAVAGKIHVFWKDAILLIALVAFQIGAGILVRYVGEKCRSQIENDLKSDLLMTLFQKSYADVTNVHSGEWLNRLTSDCRIASSGIVDILPPLTGLIVRLVSAIVAILTLEIRFIYVIIPGGLILVLLSAILRKKLKAMHKAIQEADGRLRVLLQEQLGSLMMIKAFSAEEASAEDAGNKMEEHRIARLKRTAFSTFSSTGLSAAMTGVYLLGFIYCGIGLVHGTITYGTMTALLQLINQVQSPFANLSGYVPRYYAMIASTERLIEAKEFRGDNPCTEAEDKLDDAALTFQKIEFHHVSFSYPRENLMVLNDFQFVIHEGDSIAVMGHSGSGKSTIFKLLLSLYPLDEGKIIVKDERGRHELGAGDRRLFAYVPQGNQLMNGTIRDVICFHLPFESSRMERALKISCAEEFVRDLPDGIDTMLGERGAGLSEGQMQRIAIARAIYAGNPILLLDEATSALDEKTEQKLLQNIQKLTNSTVLIVTHRPAALKICNQRLDIGLNRIR